MCCVHGTATLLEQKGGLGQDFRAKMVPVQYRRFSNLEKDQYASSRRRNYISRSSLAISGLAGLATDGVSALAKKGTTVVGKTLAKNVGARIAAKTAINTTANVTKQAVKGEKINFGEDLMEGLIGGVIDERIPDVFAEGLAGQTKYLGKAANAVYKETLSKGFEWLLGPNKKHGPQKKNNIFALPRPVDHTDHKPYYSKQGPV